MEVVEEEGRGWRGVVDEVEEVDEAVDEEAKLTKLKQCFKEVQGK